MSRQLLFSYEWHLATTPTAVWGLLTRISDWPLWWPVVSEVRFLLAGNHRGEGAMMSSVWEGCFTPKVDVMMRIILAEENIMMVTKSHGDLHGLARWELTEIPVGTTVRYTGDVTIHHWWSWGYPILKPLIDRHFQRIMHAGAVGMAGQLDVELIDYNQVNLSGAGA